MIRSVKEGWRAALQQPFLLYTLFVYRFAWSFAIYRTVESVVLPLLRRYPGKDVSAAQVQLFLAESEFRLTKTDLSHSFLWLLLGLLLARMLLTPLVNAGLFYSLSQTHYNPGYRFFRGIRELGWPFILYYWLQMLLTLLPLYYLWPKMKTVLENAYLLPGNLAPMWPWILGWAAYAYLLRLLFVHLQFGRTEKRPLLGTLLQSIGRLFPILAAAVLLLLFAALLSGAVMASTLIWAGFWTLLLYQAFGFVRTFFSLWSLTAQHSIYERKAA